MSFSMVFGHNGTILSKIVRFLLNLFFLEKH